ncbi:prepilin-type N-terminal cleavage/methylation domain-containing protein [Pseudomonas sp. JZ134]
MKVSMRGFTLLEVLLAISLLGILLALIGSALISANRTLARSEQYSARLDELRSTQNFLRRELQQALPLSIQRTPTGQGMVFIGEPQEMRFIATLPSHLGGGIHIQTLRLAGDSRDQWLQVDFAKIVGNNRTESWGDPQRLLRQVRNLRFSYSGLDQNGRPTDWLPRWPWPQHLPQRVRVDLTADGPIAWPPLQVAVRLDLGNSNSMGSLQ